MKVWLCLLFMTLTSSTILKKHGKRRLSRNYDAEEKETSLITLDNPMNKVKGKKSVNRKSKDKDKKDVGFTKELEDIRSEIQKQKEELAAIEKKRQDRKVKKKDAEKRRRKRKLLARRRKHYARKHKSHKKKKVKHSEARKRKLLLKKFYNLDGKQQVRKLVSIYKSYGINIKKLNSKDLKYIIQNSKELLRKYHETSDESPVDRGLQGVAENSYPQPQTQPQIMQNDQAQQPPQYDYQNMNQQGYPTVNQQALPYQPELRRQLVMSQPDGNNMMQNQNANQINIDQNGIPQNNPALASYPNQPQYYS